MTAERELHLVELVALDGRATGSATVAEAHAAPGMLHRAFSVLLFDDDGRTLLQQRAAVKSRFPNRWANTCCGHPGPGEPVVEAAARRLKEELGIAGVGLADIGVYAYAATDPATGRVEREYDHVVVGRVRGSVSTAADPAEVAELRWAEVHALSGDLTENPATYAPWLRGVVGIALPVM